ncbi:PfkB family carbohydrate kinase [Roseovarius sp.]|uniref:PfkB family carbohydrate kinase n=1 Tax=Roseovarius sp. TaxID=1486281 RepID=UPI003BAD43B0
MSGGLLQLSGVVVDLIYRVEALPRSGGEAIVTGFDMAPGGGFNAMVAARRAGMAVRYGGGIGSGPFGEMTRRALAAEGIEVLREVDEARDQGCCTVMVEPTGERSFVASEGADGQLGREALERVLGVPHDWVLLSGYALHYKGMAPALDAWLEGEVDGFVFDPSPVVAALPRGLVMRACERAAWVSANAVEAEVLTGHGDPVAAARALAAGKRGGGAVVRLGAEGCVVASAEGCEAVAAHAVAVVDTNGAGDTHLGSFIARLAQGAGPMEAARYANVAAALSATRYGPATAPGRAEVLAAMARTEPV